MTHARTTLPAASPVQAAIAAHRAAYDAFQVAPEGEASERAENRTPMQSRRWRPPSPAIRAAAALIQACFAIASSRGVEGAARFPSHSRKVALGIRTLADQTHRPADTKALAAEAY